MNNSNNSSLKIRSVEIIDHLGSSAEINSSVTYDEPFTKLEIHQTDSIAHNQVDSTSVTVEDCMLPQKNRPRISSTERVQKYREKQKAIKALENQQNNVVKKHLCHQLKEVKNIEKEKDRIIKKNKDRKN